MPSLTYKFLSKRFDELYNNSVSRKTEIYPPNYDNLLDGNPSTAMTIYKIPDIPDVRHVVAKHINEYRKNPYVQVREETRSEEMRNVDIRIGVTIKSVLHEMGASDIWTLIWEGKIAVSGSFLLYLTDNMAKKWDGSDFHKSDIDIYKSNTFKYVQVGDYVYPEPSAMWNYAQSYPSCYDREFLNLDGFSMEDWSENKTNAEGVSNHYHIKTWSRRPKINNDHTQKLPNKIQFINRNIVNCVHDFDLQFLSNYYTAGRLYICKPETFLGRIARVQYSPRDAWVNKYIDRGFAVIYKSKDRNDKEELIKDDIRSIKDVKQSTGELMYVNKFEAVGKYKLKVTIRDGSLPKETAMKVNPLRKNVFVGNNIENVETFIQLCNMSESNK